MPRHVHPWAAAAARGLLPLLATVITLALTGCGDMTDSTGPHDSTLTSPPTAEAQPEFDLAPNFAPIPQPGPGTAKALGTPLGAFGASQPATPLPSLCLEPHPGFVDRLAVGLADPDLITISRSAFWPVKVDVEVEPKVDAAPDRPAPSDRTWFLAAAVLEGEGLGPGTVAVWATNLDPNVDPLAPTPQGYPAPRTVGVTYAINGHAEAYSTFERPDDLYERFRGGDADMIHVRACVEKPLGGASQASEAGP